MTSGVSGSSVDSGTRTSEANETSSVGSTSRSTEEGRSELRSAVESTPDSATTGVAREIAGDADTVVGSSGTVAPPKEGELSNEHFEAAERFRDEFDQADLRDHDIHAQRTALENDDYRSGDEIRRETLNGAVDYADGIDDPQQREAFVREIAPDAGRAAGLLANRGPGAAYNTLDRLGRDVSPETAGLLANSAISVGQGRDLLVPQGIRGTPVGDAFSNIRNRQTQGVVDGLGTIARTVVPGVDAATHAANGDFEAAGASAAVDLAGGAILRGGKLVVGAVTAGVALAPESAEAGVLQRFALRSGDEVFEVSGRRLPTAGGRGGRVDVTVNGRFADGSSGTLRLDDPRGKHNAISDLPDGNIKRAVRALNKNRADAGLAPARNAGQFSNYYNSVEGQGELARIVMSQVPESRLAELGKQGGSLRIELDRVVGIASRGNGQVSMATSVTVMRNGDGSFHLVPMP